MFKRQCARTLIAISAITVGGLVGCESTDFNYPGKSMAESAQPTPGSSYTPDFNQAQLASARLPAQGNVIDNKLFTMEANSDSRLMMEMAKVAQQRSNDPEVRRLAGQIIQDHQKIDNQIKSLAQARNYSMAEALLPQQQTSYGNLEIVNGAAFDSQFLQSQVQTLQDMVQLYSGGADQLLDGELRSFASQTLPTLQDELETTRNDMSKIGSAVR